MTLTVIYSEFILYARPVAWHSKKLYCAKFIHTHIMGKECRKKCLQRVSVTSGLSISLIVQASSPLHFLKKLTGF